MQFDDSKKFIEMLQHTRKTVEMLLKIDKNPPSDIKIFIEVLDELQSAAELVTNDKEWVNFFFNYSEDIEVVLAFVQNLSSIKMK